MRRPLLGLVFCYLAGTFCGVWLSFLAFPGVFFIAGFALIFACILNFRGKYYRAGEAGGAAMADAFTFTAVFITGWLAVDLRINNPSARDLSRLMDKPREGIELIGFVADDPELRAGRGDGKKYWSFDVNVEAVSRIGVYQAARGKVRAILTESSIRPRYGERWQFSGVLVDSHRLAEFAGADAWKIPGPRRFRLYVSSRPAPAILERASRRDLLYWCFLIREKCSLILSRGIEHHPEVIAILQALVLGRQHELPLAMREAFVATGTYHIFAISGQHVAIIALFIVFVLQFYGVCRLNWFYYLAPVLIVFTIMTGMSASAVRGCLMALMCFAGTLFKRKTDVASAMALAAALIIVADPLQLFQAGFLLSFGIVAGLIVLCPPLVDMGERFLAPDPYRLEPEKWPARRAREFVRWLLFVIIASFAAWLVSTPLIARWFNLVSLVALFANLLIIPLATLVLLSGCLSIATGWCCPLISEAFNFANVFFVSLMAGLTGIMARIPFGHFFIRSPPLWFVCSWLGVLIVWRIYYRQIRIWLPALLALAVAGALGWSLNRNEWEIHVLNIDRSAVCLVSTKWHGDILVNTGPEYQARALLRYLRKTGVNRLRILACPAPDARHAGAAGNIVASMPVGEIYFSERKSKTMTDFIRQAGEFKIEMKELKVGNDSFLPVCSGNDFNLLVGANATAPMAVKIAFKTGQEPSVVLLEEQRDPLARENVSRAVTQEVCRIICRPVSEQKEWLPPAGHGDILIDDDYFLGPGQAVVLMPERGKINVLPTTLFP
jgi:ComEC/Rec2-related protein